jgi:hypothetical protein
MGCASTKLVVPKNDCRIDFQRVVRRIGLVRVSDTVEPAVTLS